MKVYYNGRRINGRFDSLKAKVRRLVHLVKIAAILGLITTAAGMFGAAFFSTSTVSTIVQAETPQEPVLERIADCESGNGSPHSSTHYRNGQVLLRANTNGTIDIGKYQVNLTYWGAKASQLKYDLTKEADNKAMAEWIYHNKGTGDWSSSQKCWYR